MKQEGTPESLVKLRWLESLGESSTHYLEQTEQPIGTSELQRRMHLRAGNVWDRLRRQIKDLADEFEDKSVLNRL